MEMKLLDFHINNLEYACGATLSNVSALNWDQNERFPQFQGDHTIVTYGFSDILERLAKPLNIRYNTPVDTVTDTGDQIVITDIAGQKFKADRCIVTGIDFSKEIILLQPFIASTKKLTSTETSRLNYHFDRKFRSKTRKFFASSDGSK